MDVIGAAILMVVSYSADHFTLLDSLALEAQT
jgi:hypothetical protein